MESSTWLTEKETCVELGVSTETLRGWREIGYLKPGTHWRSSPYESHNPWTPQVIYHVRWCREIIEYWKKEDAVIFDKAA